MGDKHVQCTGQYRTTYGVKLSGNDTSRSIVSKIFKEQLTNPHQPLGKPAMVRDERKRRRRSRRRKDALHAL